jgi:hypothetical protein
MVYFGMAVRVDKDFSAKHELHGLLVTVSVFAWFFPVLSIFAGGIYLARWGGMWSSKKMLKVETAIDVVSTVWHGVLMGLMGEASTRASCGVGVSAICDTVNGVVAALVFGFTFWLVALILDCISWYQAINAGYADLDDPNQSYRQRLRSAGRQ